MAATRSSCTGVDRSGRRRRRQAVRIAAAAFAMLCGGLCPGQVAVSYVGAPGGAWHVATNWQPQVIPDNNPPATYYTAITDRPITINGSLFDVAGLTTTNSIYAFSGVDFRAADGMPFLLNTGTFALTPALATAAALSAPSGNTLTISGGGVFRLGGDGLAVLAGGGTIVNHDNAIRGEGSVGMGVTAFVNNGLFAATEASPGVVGTLTVFAGPGGFRNGNTLQARADGVLALRGVFNNAGGTIVADAGGLVTMGLAEFTGGTVTSAATGSVLVNNNVTWSGQIANTGRTVVNDDLTISGIITNTGSMTINGGGAIRVESEATLDGNGTIFLNGGAINRVGANTATLTTSNYITGAGVVGSGTLTIINAGTIRASGGALFVAHNLGMFNNGTMAADGGTLEFLGREVFNGSGTVLAANNSCVRLNNAEIIGGKLRSIGNGSFLVPVANLARLNNVTDIDAHIFSLSSSVVEVKGQIGGAGGENVGTLTLVGGSSVRVVESATFSISRVDLGNGGQIVPGAGSFGPEAGVQFFNDGTISGSGQIGVNALQIVNDGVIQGNGGSVGLSNPLTLDPGPKGLTNAGVIESTALGVVVLTGNGSGQFSQTGMAVIRATDPASNVQMINNLFLTGGNIGAGAGTVSLGGAITFESLDTDANVVQAGVGQLLINGDVNNTGTITTGSTLVVAGSSTLNSASGHHVNQGTISVSGGGYGDFNFVENASMFSVGRILVSPNGLVTFHSIDQGTLSIANNGFASIKSSFAPGADGSVVGTLSIGTMGAALDITNRGVAVDYPGGFTPLSAIAAQITSGYAGGAWTGPGIRSSSAAAEPGFGIGYAEAAQIGSPTSFLGRPIDGAGSVLLRFTLYGDANLNGTVDIADFSALAANFNAAGPWVRGDFNYSGTVTIADFALLAGNFNRSLPADDPARRAGVPEPSHALAAVLAAFGPMSPRRRAAASGAYRAQRAGGRGETPIPPPRRPALS